MASQKIRIKLKAYDHNLVDLAAEKIVETAGARDINLLRSELDAFTLCGEIYRLCHE